MKSEYRYETHLHTSDASACARSTGAEHVVAHHAAGYTGLVVADHFFNGNCAIDSSLPWDERVRGFCKGYENARDAAKDLDFDVFFAFEKNYSGTEFLTYGVDKEFLLSYPDLLSWSPEAYFDKVHEAVSTF